MQECRAKIMAWLCVGAEVRYGRQLKREAGEGGGGGGGSGVKGWLSQTPMCA